MTNAICGPRPTVPFASWDPATSSWRTYQGSLLTGTLAEYLETWPKAGTMRSGTLLRLRESEHRTAANASSSWPTPVKSDSNHREPSENWDGSDLVSKVSQWPTPRSIYGEHSGMTHEKHLTGQAIGMWPTPTQDDTGNRQKRYAQGGEPISMAAALWDTPKATPEHGGPNQRDGQGRLYLDAQARQWPTPQTHDVRTRGNTMADGHHYAHDRPEQRSSGTSMADTAGSGQRACLRDDDAGQPDALGRGTVADAGSKRRSSLHGSRSEEAESGLADYRFPPGPDDPAAWARVLAEVPEVEPAVCRVAHGVPDRTHRIRALGNAVVAAQGAYAFRLLWQRMMEQKRGA